MSIVQNSPKEHECFCLGIIQLPELNYLTQLKISEPQNPFGTVIFISSSPEFVYIKQIRKCFSSAYKIFNAPSIDTYL